jgi:hypothetical protein
VEVVPNLVKEKIMNVPVKKVVKAKPPVNPKRLYAAPVLSEYGDIRQTTLGGAKSTTQSDHGHNHKS